jgi:hypothetical protein
MTKENVDRIIELSKQIDNDVRRSTGNFMISRQNIVNYINKEFEGTSLVAMIRRLGVEHISLIDMDKSECVCDYTFELFEDYTSSIAGRENRDVNDVIKESFVEPIINQGKEYLRRDINYEKSFRL